VAVENYNLSFNPTLVNSRRLILRYEDKILRSLVAVVKTTEQIGPDEYIPRSIVKILEEGTTIEELIDWYSRKFPLSIEISGIEITEAS